VNKKNYWVILLILGIISLVLLRGFYRWAYDDPFISYRYANNLVRGLGFVYNPGERILSTTTPLFTLILALTGLISADFHIFAIGIGVISLAIGALFIFDLGNTWDDPIVGWTGLLLYPIFPLVVSTLGSETPVYLAFCLGAFAFYARKNFLGAGIFAVLATLTRPDALLVIGILGMDFIIRRRKPIPWKSILVSSVLLIGWIVFAWIYFGSPIPVTLAAKQQQGLMANSESFARGFLTVISSNSSWFLISEVALALMGLILAFWKKRIWLLILIWPVVYFLSYSILGVTRYFWYYAPLIPGFIIAAGLGLTAFSELIKGSIQGRKSLSQFAVLIPGIVLFILFTGSILSLWQLRKSNDPRFGIYKAAGEWLRENTLPSERVGSLEVGIIGYFAQRPMVDFAGLIQPETAEQFSTETTYQDAAFFAVEKFQPQYVVLHDGWFGHFEDAYIKDNCVKVKRFKGKPYSYDFNLTVFDCR
jgi:hypothetical protein